MFRFLIGVIVGIYIALYGIDGFVDKVSELYDEAKTKISDNTSSN